MEEGQNSTNRRTHSPITHGAGPNGDQGSQGNNQHLGMSTIRKTECAVGSFRLHN